MTKKYNHYLGKAGHLAVMSEFLVRGWNVAIPEVDVGDDIFVVKDDSGTLRRVQVKTSMATERRNGLSGQFNLSLRQLRKITAILIHYVFILRHHSGWSMPLIIRQDYLLNHVETNQIGSIYGDKITLYFSQHHGQTVCSSVDFSPYKNDYSDFPIMEH